MTCLSCEKVNFDILLISSDSFQNGIKESAFLWKMYPPRLTMNFIHFLAVFSVLFASASALLGLIGSKQGVTVTGRLICNGQPASGVLVKMYEDGTSELVYSDWKDGMS